MNNDNNKITQVFSKIEPNSAAKERIFREVINRAERGGVDYMRKNMVLLSGALAACVVIAATVVLLPNMIGQDIAEHPNASSLTDNDGNDDYPATTDALAVLPEYAELYRQNSDMVGYIKIDDRIDYPVLQFDDDTFYLNRDFEKSESKSGWIFADSRNKFSGLDISDNTVLYGHNMTTGEKFSALTDYYKSTVHGSLEFYKENPVIRFDTLYEKMEWKVFAVVLFNTQEEFGEVFEWNIHEFYTKDEFNNYIPNVIDRSVLFTDVDIEHGDKILTLSTCYWPLGADVDTRLAVFARKVRPGESSDVNVEKAGYKKPFE
ncbi:MAG: class B sortase [Oscillospiraceae bacterium]|nr:class B sortase [Oscillospiraceae bacterium]